MSSLSDKQSYEVDRRLYKPVHIHILFIAESPPPTSETPSSRHFYRTDTLRHNDRLFINTIKTLYPQAAELSEAQLEQAKDSWLRTFQQDGYYMIEALDSSLPHEVTKQQRQEYIRAALPVLIRRVSELVEPNTKIILIKSNVFEVAAEPLRKAGLAILNTELIDYPGHFTQKAYRQKLAGLLEAGARSGRKAS